MILSTSKFTYNKNHKGFVAEASDLASAGYNIFHRLYPDACDVGITLISEKTGTEVTYYVETEGCTNEEDYEITHWTLRPTPESLKKVPRCRGTYITIFND